MKRDSGVVAIVVDGSRCDGHGICALVMPERISLDAWGYASVDGNPIEDTRTLNRAKRAISACPVRALALVGPVDVEVRLRGRRARLPKSRVQ
ncbi:MAG TPA: ferredoxin [Acidimicrobiales bacterium]|nr:ferredoxin [Acidimicrobiales bacterium]